MRDRKYTIKQINDYKKRCPDTAHAAAGDIRDICGLRRSIGRCDKCCVYWDLCGGQQRDPYAIHMEIAKV